MITSVIKGRPKWMIPVSLFAILFGILTLKEGGSVLFIDGPARKAAGNYVSFVLWFNFLAGFAYVAAGIGLLRLQRWAVRLAILIAVSTLFMFAAFGTYVFMGGAYEIRTAIAMTIRSTVWIAIALITYKKIMNK